jgi:hypothetical protein
MFITFRSTSEKISYHFIHANPSVLFENNISLGLFVKGVMHLLLWLITQHKCSSFDISLPTQKYSIADLIIVLAPYVNTLRSCCGQCQLYTGCITVAEMAYLLVLNKQNQLTLAIDLSVYSKNQQFRLFDCVKRGKNNPLVPSTQFPFNNDFNTLYFDLLRKSIVTYSELFDVPIIYLKNNQFVCVSDNIKNSLIAANYNHTTLNHINSQIDTIFISGTRCISDSSLNKSNISDNITHCIIDQCQQQIQQFTSFVEKIIKLDRLHQGYIRSCVRGNQNKDLLFFNIGGEYRFCPRKGTHHQRNTTAILIDTNNLTYSIRCKDPDCNNTLLRWNIIE